MWNRSKLQLYQSITRQAAAAVHYHIEFFPGQPIEHMVVSATLLAHDET